MVVSAHATKYRVLVIEEETLLRMILEEMVQELGYEVITGGGTFEAAMQSARVAQFDVAILDMRIHGMLTFPVADILARRNLPYVFATGIMPTPVPSPHWGRPVLKKPFEYDEVRRVLDQILA